jgi:hypothetical protein
MLQLLLSGELMMLLSASVGLIAGESQAGPSCCLSHSRYRSPESGCLKVLCSYLKQVCCLVDVLVKFSLLTP